MVHLAKAGATTPEQGAIIGKGSLHDKKAESPRLGFRFSWRNLCLSISSIYIRPDRVYYLLDFSRISILSEPGFEWIFS